MSEETDFENMGEDDFDFGPSKSSKKRAMKSLQDLGKALAGLKPDQIQELPVSDRLRDALLEYQRFPSHEAKRRQLQFIGKLMREVDEAEIRERLHEYQEGSATQTAIHHQSEHWREQLLSGSNEALTEFVEQFPVEDIQHLRHLVSNACKDVEQNINRGASLKLFRFIREQIEASQPENQSDQNL